MHKLTIDRHAGIFNLYQMATLESDESNILDAETVNWRLIVYPILAALVILVGGLGYYYYLQTQREDLESKARAALVAGQDARRAT